MQNENLVPASECCRHYEIELSFINYLHDYGLIQVTSVKEQQFIPETQLQILEKYIRLHYDLNINIEGIEAIHHLLARVETLQQEIISLKNKIYFSDVPPSSSAEF